MAKQTTKKTTTKPAGVKIPAALAEVIKATGKTAYLSGAAWFFNEKTAKKHFGENYKTVTPNDIK